MNAKARLVPCCLAALCVLSACSQSAAPSQTGATMSPASTAAPTNDGGNKVSSNPCDVITAADVAGILVTPATRKDGSEPGSCRYETQTHGQVAINVAQGDSANFWWSLATTSQGANVPLAGVGDKALYNKFSGGRPLIARKGDMTCYADVVGYDNSGAMDSITKDRGEALARKLGALCTKVFAAH
ncbi:MAG: hypothetical protein OJF61_002104 [Rhodanobacteraceae bacterium]|nr:MAG: hypothetical protein OJF61_002104 [Rhodanobacteraceae bacterium]